MTVFDDLEAEQDRLGDILAGLSDAQWAAASLAPGWTVRDVVLHLAQGEEMALARLSGAPNPAAHDPAQAQHDQHSQQAQHGRTVEQIMAALVEADPATPAQALRRWQQARGAAMDLLRAADPQRRIEWAAAPLKPAALATTRLAEHWTHGLDVTGPLGVDFPDTARLRHVAWLAHRMLPYAYGLAGQPGRGDPGRAHRPGRHDHLGVRAAGRRIGHHRGRGRVLPGRRPAAARGPGRRSHRSHRSRPANQRPGRSPGAGPPPQLRGLMMSTFRWATV